MTYLRPLVFLAIALSLFAVASAPPTAAQEFAQPVTPPDAANGLQIFAARCAPCHGPAGNGDGELAPNLPSPPAAFTDPELLRNLTPAGVFDTVTNGRIANGMPPFGPENSDPLTIDERWDMVAAVYSLGIPASSRESGAANYEPACAECHGAAGNEIATADLTDLTQWLTASNQALFTGLASVAEHDGIALSDSEQWSVIDYIRGLALPYVDPLAAFKPLEQVTVSGIVVNQTTGAAAPAGTVVRVRAFDQFAPVFEETTTLSEDGAYTLTLTDIPREWIFVAGVTVNDVEFSSAADEPTLDAPDLDLPIAVFETTTDPESIIVERIHVVIQFFSGRLGVAELYLFSTTGNRVYVGPSGNPADGTLALSLPAGVENVAFERGFGGVDTFIPAPEIIPSGTGWVDTVPVRPGTNRSSLLVRYDLPYDQGVTLAHPVDYTVQQVSMVIADGAVRMTDTDWINQGEQDISNQVVQSFTRAGFNAGDALRFTLDGRPERVTDLEGNAILVRNETSELIAGGIGLLLVGVLAGTLLVRWRQEAQEAEADEEAFLVSEIAELDEMYADGEIDTVDYQRERRRLKARLLDLYDAENALHN